MRTFVIEGKPLEEVTIKVEGQSLTLTKDVEVTVIVVVASQQKNQADEYCSHNNVNPISGTCYDCHKVIELPRTT